MKTIYILNQIYTGCKGIVLTTMRFVKRKSRKRTIGIKPLLNTTKKKKKNPHSNNRFQRKLSKNFKFTLETISSCTNFSTPTTLLQITDAPKQ
jgi:hypothetical protein